jgi:hypothetical protein
MLSAQNQFNIGDLVRWKAEITTANPRKGYVGSVEVLGIIKKITTQLELKVLSADKGGSEYLNALKDMSAWEKLPVYMDECEVIA